jgi:hypothetical protein
VDEFIIWAAGLFDGEGGITIHRPSYELLVTLTNSCKPALVLFKQKFRGNIGTTVSSTSHKPCYQYYFTWDGAREFLTLVLPYLRIKKLEAQLALDYISTISSLASLRGGRRAGRKLTGVERKARMEFRRQLKAIRATKTSVIPSERYTVPQGRLFGEN